MKKQKSSRLFRALLCSSAIAGMTGPAAMGQDGVAQVRPQPDGSGPDGREGDAFNGLSPDGASLVPAYGLPQYQGDIPETLIRPAGDPIWQDQLGPRVRMETRIGEWLGSEDDGQASVNVMLPFWFGQSDVMMFLDTRGTVTDAGGGAGNLGLGFRRYDQSRDRVFGINTYWDYDDGNQREYQQVGFGIESLGRWVDIRANAHFNLGDDREVISTSFENPVIGAGPNGLTVDRVENVESAFSGFNVEIGTPTPVLGRYGFETHVGGYYFQAEDNEDVTGVAIRNEIQISDDIRAGVSLTNDDVFDTQVFATLSITIPDGRPQRWFRPKRVREKMSSRVERRNRVMTARRVKRSIVDGTGAATVAGMPELRSFNRVLIVDPESASNGVGSADDPLQTFVGFSNSGTGTLFIVKDGDLQGPLTMLNDDVVVSDDYLNNVGLTIATPAGAFAVGPLDATPAVSTWGNSAGGDILTINGDHTQASGFIFDGSVNVGIPANNNLIVGGDFQGFQINHNDFRNYRQAITLSNVTGSISADAAVARAGQLYSNSFLGTSGFGAPAGQASVSAFSLTNSGVGTLDLEVGATQYNQQTSSLAASGNLAYGNDGEDLNGNGVLDAGEDVTGNGILDAGFAFSVTAGNQATINARFHGNETTRESSVASEDTNQNGILDLSEDLNSNGVLDFGGDLNRNGRLDGGNGQGIVVTAGLTQSTINLAIVDNILADNTGDAIQLTANSGTINAASLGEDVNGNGLLDIEDVNLDGVFDGSEDLNFDGILALTEDLNGNGILDPGEDANGDGVFDTNDEDANGNGILDFNDDLDNDGTFDFGEDALEPDTNSNGILDGDEDLNGDTFRNQGDMDLLLDGGFLITGNTITGNGGGFSEDTNGNGTLDPGEDANSDGLLSVGGDAIQGIVTNNGNLSLIVTANTIGSPSAGNSGAGLNLNAVSGQLNLQLGFINDEDTDLDGLLDAGEDANSNGRLDVPLTTDANTFVANGSGVIFNLTGSAIGQIDAIGNTFTGDGGGILGFQVNGDTTGNSIGFSNLSPVGIDISRVIWDVAPAGLEFNSDASVNGGALLINNNSDQTTGLQSINGTTGPFVIPDLATQLDAVFTDFNPINEILDPGEDLDGDGILDPDEDLNMNGILDGGEDLNGNGLLDPAEDQPDRFEFTVDLDLQGTPSSVMGNDLIGSVVTATFSTGQSVTGALQADPNDATGSLFVPTSVQIGEGAGFVIAAADTSTLVSSQIRDNIISNFGGEGLSVTAQDSAIVQPITIRGNTISDNGQNSGPDGQRSGIELAAIGTSAVLTAEMMSNTLERNVGGGVNVDVESGTLSISNFQQNILAENGAGFEVNAAAGAAVDIRMTNNSITDSVINGDVGGPMTSGNGVSIVSDASTVTINEIAKNAITSNAGDGILLEAINTGVINVTPTEDLNGDENLGVGEDTDEDINGNGTLDPGEDVNGDGMLNRGNGNGQLDRGIYMNLLSSNAGNNFEVIANDGTVNLGTVSENQLSGSLTGLGGVQITAENSSITGSFTGNSVNLDSINNPNAGPGFFVSSTDGTVDLVIGGPDSSDRNSFTRSAGAGIAAVLAGSGTGTLEITNNLITSVTDDLDNNSTFDGDGISIALIGSPSVVNSTVRLVQSEVSGNVIGDFANTAIGLDGSGIAIQAREETAIDDLLVASNQIGQVGQDAGNDHAGIEFDRVDSASINVVNPRPGQLRGVTIIDNIATDNDGGLATTVAGLDINVGGGIRDDVDFEIIDNDFSRNSGDGILLTTRADASLSTDMRGNLIEDNGFVTNPVTLLPGNGITVNGVETVIDDLETQGGTWISNTIRNNLGNGIQINSVVGDIIPLIIGLDGSDPISGESLGNTITGNAADGIEINSGGFVQINNNLIGTNGGSGIDVNAVAMGLQASLVQRNSIQNNGEDGIEYQTLGGFADVGYLIAFGNSITGNQSRGIDILNQGSAVGNFRIGDGSTANSNIISSNVEEGVYVVNTASLTQGQGPLTGTTPLNSDGPVIATPNMILDINRNTIEANNSVTAGFAGGGLAVRVGTSGASPIFFGADASGAIPVLNGVGSNSAGLLDGNGRINARVTDNTFDGNQGEDVLFESFVSTVDPIVTTGAWDAMNFTPMAYEGDPLARLNLVFRGNTGQSLDVTRAGASYNNAEGTFKSKLVTSAPGGPFTSATRERNAQRIPSRDAEFAFPLLSPDFGFFEYAGVGVSTFRIESDFETTNFLTGDTFAIDGLPVPPALNVNPNAAPLGILNGELGFSWGSALPGTFQFDEPFQGLFGLP